MWQFSPPLYPRIHVFARLAPAVSFRATPTQVEFGIGIENIKKLSVGVRVFLNNHVMVFFGFERDNRRQNVNNTGTLLTWPMSDLD